MEILKEYRNATKVFGTSQKSNPLTEVIGNTKGIVEVKFYDLGMKQICNS